MARNLNTLDASTVRHTKFTGKNRKLFDGGGLFLHVQASGKYWRFKYRYAGKEKLLGLGVYPEVSLAQARSRRDEFRSLVAQQVDPGLVRKNEKLGRLEAAQNSFESVAREWFSTIHCHEVVESHSRNNLNRLTRHVFPFIGARPISEINPPELLNEVLRRIEEKGTLETAQRVKILCGQIMRYAIQTGRAERDITADLKGALRTPKVQHHPAIIEKKKLKSLLLAIENYDGHPTVQNALRLLPLLFVRPGELRNAKWEDFDLEKAEWDYTPSKGALPFIFPLSSSVVSILKEQRKFSGGSEFVFPSPRSDSRPMSNNTLNAALHRLDFKGEMTAHGFRATARTLLAEELGFPFEVIEQQLAHSVRDANGRAYNRTTFLEQRREMMEKWDSFLQELETE